MRILLLFLIALQSDSYRVNDLFLGLSLDQDSDYDKVRNGNFKLYSTSKEYADDRTIRAKFIGKSQLYAFADSVHIKVWPSNSYGQLKDGQWTDIKPGKELIVTVYVNDSSTVRLQYDKLKTLVPQLLLHENPAWKNHMGARPGIYFISEQSAESITIGKDLRKNWHLRITRSFFGH